MPLPPTKSLRRDTWASSRNWLEWCDIALDGEGVFKPSMHDCRKSDKERSDRCRKRERERER